MKLGPFELDSVVCGDSYKLIKELPDKSVDLIVTDPPYELDTEGSKENSISKSFANCNSQISNICEGIKPEILDEFMRIMKKPNIYIWCNKKQIPMYLDYFVVQGGCKFEIMTWLKTNPTPLCGGNYLIDKEFCLYFRDGIKLNTTFDTASTWWISQKNVLDKNKFEHPTIKPQFILDKLIKNSSKENDIVFDPFAGSGSTLVSAKNNNRHYLGIDIEKKWVDVAKDRLNNTDQTGQYSMFTI